MWRFLLVGVFVAGCSSSKHDALLFVAPVAQRVAVGELTVAIEQDSACTEAGVAQVVVTRGASELFRDVLPRPCASLTTPLDVASAPVVGITVDTSAEFGTWSGPTTRLLLLADQPRWLDAVDSRGSSSRLELLSSIKSVWAVTAPAEGRGDVLHVQTRLDEQGHFVIARRRIHCEDRCEVRERVERGFREWDTHDFFPELAKFPQ